MTSRRSASYNQNTCSNIPRAQGPSEFRDIEKAIPPTPIHLGGSPGQIIAALPSMLGFHPDNSVLVIGLLPHASQASRMRVGPVVRADADWWSLDEALRAMAAVTGETAGAQAVAVAVMGSGEKAASFLDATSAFLATEDIECVGLFWVDAIDSGATWRARRSTAFCRVEAEGDPLWVEEGAVTDVRDNPVSINAAVSGALYFRDREELEAWLDPWPGGGRDDGGVPPGPSPCGDCTPSAHIPCGGQLYGATATVVRALHEVRVQMCRTAQSLCNDDDVIGAVALLAGHRHTLPLLLVVGLGENFPVLRPALADAVRRLAGPPRIRAMIGLAHLLAGAGEGVVASHTMQRAVAELETVAHGSGRGEGGPSDQGTAQSPQHMGSQTDTDPWVGREEVQSLLAAHYVGEVSRHLSSYLAEGRSTIDRLTRPGAKDLVGGLKCGLGCIPASMAERGRGTQSGANPQTEELRKLAEVVDWLAVSAVMSAPGRRGLR
ncbi:DUF4192 family protein [Corynebacterium heidelbergense]|uniref:DUF4192 domain-containing protein n=1 Tax=Corynebacterium heidelbergense TaxID=2055947 RepID=A0A364V631_9CORY|nr:DUF4192 family protein [Corynebacterium heidelbergense]RAV32102.1 hypothetical protein DLJ54_04850 [Corynebacterium heidelbergense]